MSLRLKLLLAALPLALALVLVGVVSALTVDTLGTTSNRILRDNYRSALAAQRMKESIERMDSAALFRIAGATDKAELQARTHRIAFEAELQTQEENITEPGEEVLTARLRAEWTDYLAHYDDFGAAPRASGYFVDLEPRFLSVKSTADEILALNQDAMVRKSDAARETGDRAENIVTWSSMAALVLGLFASSWITSRLLRPLDNLSMVARRLGEGELSVRANVMGRDELAAVADEFNEMAARLETFRKSSLGELLNAQLASQAAIDSIPDPVVVFGIDGRLLSSNRAADSDLELAMAEGHPLGRVEPALRGAIERARDHVLSGKGNYVPKGFEDAVAAAAVEGERWYLPRATPLYSEADGVTGVTVIVQDVTRLRRFDELRNDMVATVAHEFRTPLTSLRMAIHLCVEGAAGELTEKQLDLLGAAREDCERLQAIVDDLLDLARLQAGRIEIDREPVRPESLVERAVDAQRGEAERVGVHLETRVTPSIDAVLVDRSRIELVLDNLVSNALWHSPPGGTVLLVAEPGDDSVRFEVRDEGPGVPDEYHARVFDRFFRIPGDAAARAGLGLSIAREIVEAHGGEIGVTRAPGRGALFWFTIPVRISSPAV
jgi:two-component system, NtrC family, sensor histidine kinase KinB